jgi:hypothetical protein
MLRMISIEIKAKFKILNIFSYVLWGKSKSLCLIIYNAMKTYRGLEVSLTNLDLGTIWRWLANLKFCPL